MGRVEGVESIYPDSYAHVLSDLYVFREIQIKVHQPWTPYIARHGIAKNRSRSVSETTGIEPQDSFRARGGVKLVDFPRMAAALRLVVNRAIGKSRIQPTVVGAAVSDHQGKSRLQFDNTSQLPASKNCVYRGRRIGHPISPFAERQFVDKAGDKVMRNIWSGRTGATKPVVVAVIIGNKNRQVVSLFGERIRYQGLQTMREALGEPHLQAIIPRIAIGGTHGDVLNGS